MPSGSAWWSESSGDRAGAWCGAPEPPRRRRAAASELGPDESGSICPASARCERPQGVERGRRGARERHLQAGAAGHPLQSSCVFPCVGARTWYAQSVTDQVPPDSTL